MEGRRYLQGIALSALVLTLLATPAEAVRRGDDPAPGEGSAELTEDGVREMIEREYANGIPAGSGLGGGGASGGGECEWSVVPYPYTGAEPPDSVGDPPSPEHALYLVYCDGAYVSTEWLGPGDAPTASTVSTLVSRLVRDVPIGLPAIQVRPAGGAITGIPSYFWVDGYRGEPVRDSLTDGAITVEIEVVLGEVVWDFGDGTAPVRGSLGEAWPERSSVRHAYRDTGAPTITVTLTLPARFRVNGGPWQNLRALTRTATIAYDVDQVQAVRDR